jgi:hypothetical protein
MNNTFNINRFGSLLAYDGRKYIRNFGITLAILCGLNLVLWLLTLIFGFTMPTLPRYGIIWLAVFLSIIMVPAKAFGDINLPREGVSYAILPVSNLEKYLSYVLFCLLTPVVIIFGSWAIDSLLTLLPWGGFEHYIRHFGFGGLMTDFVVELTEMTGEDMTGQEIFDQTVMDFFGSKYNYAIIISFIFNAGLFMFGNLLFKTHKTGKTLAATIGISYVLSMIMQIILLANGRSLFLNPENVDIATIGTLTNSMFLASNIFNTILTIALFIGLFFKLKTQKY